MEAEGVAPPVELAPEHSTGIPLLTVPAAAQMGPHTAHIVGQGAVLDRDVGEDGIGSNDHLGRVRVGLGVVDAVHQQQIGSARDRAAA